MLLIVFYVAVGLYLLAAILGWWYVRTGSEAASRGARGLAALGLAIHAAFLILWGVGHSRFPAYAPFEAFALLLACAVLGYLMLGDSLRLRALAAFVLPLIAFAGLVIALVVPAEAAARTTARSLWLPLHAVTALLGAADFLVAFAVAVMYLVQQRQLKRKSVGPLMGRMPSLDTLDRLNYQAIALGMPIFTLTLVSGIVLAIEKRPDWWANWMVGSSFVAWMVYAILLHVRLIAGWRGPKVAYLTILGFLLVAAILCGIAFLGDSLHTMRGLAPPGTQRHLAGSSVLSVPFVPLVPWVPSAPGAGDGDAS
jgi:ABC-type transport system involved in cytochrome c biogenesis permease subunit